MEYLHVHHLVHQSILKVLGSTLSYLYGPHTQEYVQILWSSIHTDVPEWTQILGVLFEYLYVLWSILIYSRVYTITPEYQHIVHSI
jgi:hypothetical protein